jgi:TATA-box binding protein (TBP) (component of TFIID and TFIIIB)
MYSLNLKGANLDFLDDIENMSDSGGDCISPIPPTLGDSVTLSPEKMQSPLDAPPEPGPIKLATISSTAKLDCYVNVEIIAGNIQLTDQIIGIQHLYSGVNRGQVKSHKKSKKPKVVKTKRKKNFITQCSFNIKLPNHKNKIHIKLYNDGNMVIVGLEKIEYIEKCIEIVAKAVSDIKGVYQTTLPTELTDDFYRLNPPKKFWKDNEQNIAKIIEFIFNQTIDLDNLKLKKTLLSHPHKDILKRAITFYNIAKNYYHVPTDHLDCPVLGRLKNALNDLTSDIIEIELPGYLSEKVTYDPKNIRVTMFNTVFTCNYNIDRAKMRQILDTKYGLHATFDPNHYQGVNAKYVSRINCQKNKHNICTCKSKNNCKCDFVCQCKEISMLIFREGKIIITGATSWEQVMDTYSYITNILKIDYHDIVKYCLNHNNKTAKLKDTINSESFVYLSKDYVLSKPQNYYFLKKLELLSLFRSEKVIET